MPEPKEKDWLNGYKNKTPIYAVYKRPTSSEDPDCKWRAGKKIFHANGDQKKAEVTILISDEIDFEIKVVKRDKEGHYIKIKGSLQEEDSSVQFSRSIVSDSLWPHESQHAKPPCPSPTPGVHSDSHSSSPWCHPAISSSVVPFFSCPQSLPASDSFPMSQLFSWGGQSTGISASASFPPKKSQGWSSEWTGWISLQSKGLSRVFSNTTVQEHQFLGAQPSSQSNSHIHTWPQEKP